MPRNPPHDEAMAEMCRSNPALAPEAINGTLADGDQVELLVVLRQIALASNGAHVVAEQRT